MDRLLRTKLYLPPPRPNLVARRRLIDALNQGLLQQRRVTLLSAPAGAGKSTLLSAWAAECGRPAAWVALDSGDSDPRRFLTYLAAALQTLPVSAGEPPGTETTAMLQAPQPLPLETILTALVNELAAVPDPFLLILDDYHTLDSPQVDEALTFLLDYQPPQLHLVLGSREDPNLPLARLRARGQLAELRAADLRFTEEETAVFLNTLMQLDLTPPEIAALDARTEGWAAGLQMAALALQVTPASATPIAAPSWNRSPAAIALSSITCWRRCCSSSRRKCGTFCCARPSSTS
jgi:LuxR family maltose regulon positive regulatory protein